MTESDYRWLANDNLPGQTIKVADGSQWHYAQGGWHETDPVPELTAADIEEPETGEDPLGPTLTNPKPADWEDAEPAAELAEDEQEPDPQPPAEESE